MVRYPMITIEQCRAARGLLGWTQQDLADATGISKTSINNFERGLTDVKRETLSHIRLAFEKKDIEFTGNFGVNKKIDTAQIFEGKDAFRKLWDDIFETLKEEGGEVLISGADENLVQKDDPDSIQQHLDRLQKHSIAERLLTKEGDTTFLQPRECYRWIPEVAFQASAPTFIYKNKVATKLWEEKMVIIIKSDKAAEAERRRFEYMWQTGKIPQKKQ